MGWSPDRRTIGCVIDNSQPAGHMGAEPGYPLVLLDLATNRTTPLTGAATTELRGNHGDDCVYFTPDGRYMLYLSSWDYLNYMADTKTGKAREADRPFEELMWPNGRKPAGLMDSHNGRILLQEEGRLYAAKRSDPSNRQRILPRASRPLFPSLSPNGRFVTIQSVAYEDYEVAGRTLSNAIWSIDLNNMTTTRIATGTAPFIW